MSGSSGNCFYIGNAMRGVLIDAGVSVRTIKKRLGDIGIGFENLYGIFVTHDHFDHVKTVSKLSEKHNIPVYTTRTIFEGINRIPHVRPKIYNSRKEIVVNEPVRLGEFTVTAFPVSHDGTENVGYTIEYRDKYFTLATDLGYICENAARQIRRANYLVLESNFDEEMLENGSYPIFLKRRIKCPTGHLSNEQTAEFLSENFHNDLKHIFLCHLSQQNNTPEKAYQTTAEKLISKGISVENNVKLTVLNRTMPTGAFFFI
ncbi:MAG: MBL fold metallo-hydrolase [Prevotellaceae bacterium]|jgi:phosphoribosyl 1,2-cyclic phosphodiesterase|nr:MBL fold metallo-hydrolase [Prevotellaceae bacterium]